MHGTEILVTVFTFLALGIQVAADGDDRGFGDGIQWHTLDDGLIESQKTNKPLMLIIHKSWCGACKAFKPKFAASNEIKTASKNFVMVNTQDDEEPKDSKYAPDGGYVPRILFLDPNGKVLNDVFNKQGNPNYKYYYPHIEGVLEAMKTALQITNDGGKMEL